MIFESSGLLGYGLGRSNDGEERARVLDDDDGLALAGVFFWPRWNCWNRSALG